VSPWTDEHLTELLTASFTAHEEDADPAVAQRIALATAPAPRRTWPALAAGAALLVLLVLLVGAYALRPDDATPDPAMPTPAPTEVGHNRMVAIAEADTLLDSTPLPPRARPAAAAPSPRLRRLPAYIGDVEPSLTRTAWWVVPMSYDDVVAWYRTHVRADSEDAELAWWTGAGTSAYTAPAVVVSYGRLGPLSTAVRVDVTLAARDVRTPSTFVPDDASSAEVTRSSIIGPDAPTPVTVTVTDPARLDAIVDAYNDLEGAATGARPRACGSPTGDFRLYAVTFHWPGHTLAVDAGQPLCGTGRGLVLDGTALPQRLEDDDALDSALAAASGFGP
jgi:hypothetical protein